jgi:anti-sigma factor RsiW
LLKGKNTMHGEVARSLEEYLSGTLKPEGRKAVEVHLEVCKRCRGEMAGMVEVAALLSELRAPEAIAPRPGFYGRVMARVGDRQPEPNFMGWFGMDLAFGRRLAFSSLLVLAALGSFLTFQERAFVGGPSPESIIGQESALSLAAAPARDSMLVTLTAYER